MKPIRIQRKRTKGWRVPQNTIYVGRPSKWGNPLKFAINDWSKENSDELIKLNLKEFRIYLKKENLDQEAKKELKGKNLACWCPLDQLCHADMLLEIANE